MGIANIIEFGGVSSDVFDVVIEGAGEYTAPKRAFESISIPGRNGAFILDKGCYENVDGKFKVVIQAATQLEFQRKVRDFKNAIVSQHGYQRLTEQYQPDTYRMATYKSGFDEEPKFIGKAAVFTLIFDCQPQRYWMDGETPIEVSDGDVIFNPTMFKAHPMLEVSGIGDISLGDDLIEVNLSTLGWGAVGGMTWDRQSGEVTYTIENASYYNVGDEIKIGKLYWPIQYSASSIPILNSLTLSLASETGSGYHNGTFTNVGFSGGSNPLTFTSGTAATKTYALVANFSYTASGTTYSGTVTFNCTAAYNGTDTVVCSCSVTKSGGTHITVGLLLNSNRSAEGFDTEIQADSSKPVVGTVFIDLDIGEAYTVEGGTISSLNDSVVIPAKLPTLKPGGTEIALDNTITDFKIIPRWWEI